MSALRLLIVEDYPDDAELVAREVGRLRPDLEWRRVETRDELQAAFDEHPWDAIVCDYTLPQLDALEALELVRERGYDGPFVVVSGAVDEETTVAAMRAGAHDYVMKSNLRRLVPALERELEEARLRAESRAAQRRLGETEELYRRVVRQLPGIVWTTDAALRVTSSSGGQLLASRAAHEEIVGRDVEELGAANALYDVAQHRRVLAGAHVYYEASWAGRDYLVHVEPFLDEHGTTDGCIGVALDVTERRAAEQALRASEARFRALIENSLDVTTVLEADGTIRYASPSSQRVLGYEPSQLVGRNAFELVHTDDTPEVAEIFRRSMQVAGTTQTTTYRALHEDGSWRLMEAVGLNLLSDPAVHGVVVTARDVTARRALEERLRQAERLEAIGQLAGGIAHDFNNILLVIRGYSTVLRSELVEPQQIEDVDEITKAADRAADLTRQLLAFGRRQVSQPRRVSVSDVVRDLESLLRRVVSEEIELALELDDAAPAIVADPAQIEQVLLNLVVNSRDATRGGGTITVRVHGVESEGCDESVTPPLRPGPYAVITVSDTGSGIAPDVLPHMFEPFFTTKAEGAGTGLGLSTVYGIVAQSGGSIGVRTSPGSGTEISIFLPAAAGAAAEREPETAPAAVESGWESVLLVEDEEPVRQLVSRVLEDAGYRVHASGLPSEALRLLGSGEPVDLLVTDVVMPEMSGYALAAEVRRSHPDVRTLFISGYARTGEREEIAGDADMPLLQKPFSPDELTHAVRRVLDGSAARAAR